MRDKDLAPKALGYTLPVFACASAIAALCHLHQQPRKQTVAVDLVKPKQIVDIDVEQVALIDEHTAIAITKSNPGDHLDLTRYTPVWAKVSFNRDPTAEAIVLKGGEGIGKQTNRRDKAAIYSYAQELIAENLKSLLKPNEKIIVTIILPEGQRLAKRTSNEAFGVVEGLSLLGTTGIVQPLTAPDTLAVFQDRIKEKAALFDELVFCIGENGIDLAQKSGIDPQRIVKTANWLGAMLVTAALSDVKSILLFGYHGKLIKLAGGIFHTHNHLADGRLEILTAYAAQLGLPHTELAKIFTSSTTEAALTRLRELDEQNNTNWTTRIYKDLAKAIDCKSTAYVLKYTEKKVLVGCVMFDRRREIINRSENAFLLLSKLC